MSLKNHPYRLNRLLALAILIVICNGQFLYGQKIIGPYKFKHLTVNDGLSQNQINDIVQDSSDFIWIGSKNGLNKFDGNQISKYYTIPFDTTSISDSYIKNLFVDSKGRLWIGSQNGIDLYDEKNDHFKRIKQINSRPQTSREIEDISEDASGKIWISFLDAGLAKISLRDSKIDVDLNPIPHLKDKRIISMYADGNDLLLGSIGSLYIYDIQTEQLTRKQTNDFITSNNIRTDNLPIGTITESVDKNYFWMGSNNALIKYKKSSGKAQIFIDKLDITRNWEGHFDDQLIDQSRNIIWLSGTHGFTTFDLELEKFIHHPFNTNQLSDISSGFINTIQQCRDGSIWFGTNGFGIDVYSTHLNRFNHFNIQHAESSEYKNFSIRSVFESSNGQVWIGSDILYCYDIERNRVKNYEDKNKNSKEFGATGAWSYSEDDSGNLWMGTWDGLYRYNLQTGKTKRYYTQIGIDGTLPEQIIYGTYIDRQQNIWAITNSYLCKLDQSNSKFDCVLLDDHQKELANVYAKIEEDIQGNFWINTNNGLLKYHPELKTKKWYRHSINNKNSLSIDKVRSIIIDDNNPQALWIGTAGGGLNRLDMNTELFTHYTVEDGLPDNVIYGILQDDKGHLWMSSNKGISQFNIEEKTFINYTTEHGLQSSEYNAGAYSKSKNGTMYFGGLNGFNYFKPEDIDPNHDNPKTIVNEFRLLDPKINSDGLSINVHELNIRNKKLILDYDQNVFQINYAAMEFGFSPDLSYEYKLEGWDQKYITSDQPQAIYSNVPHGEYIFKVRTIHGQNPVSTQKASLYIVIKPPFWLSTWAKIIYALTFLTLLYILWTEVNNRRRLKNELELEHLKSEQLKELDTFKTRFFSNISHELRTPLTLILSPLDDIISETKNAKNAKTLKQVQTNAERLLQLVNQLLDLSKAQDKKFELNTTEQPLQPYIEKISNSLKPLAYKKGISINIEINLGQRLYLFDKDILEKVLSNLISNAIKFSKEQGSINILVHCIQKLNRHILTIKVKDHGVGISKQDLPHIFDRFYRAKDIENQLTSVSGTGIGLALVKELVDKSHGSISVKSEKEFGTEFIVTLPLMISADSNRKITTTSAQPLNTQKENNQIEKSKVELDKPLILVVDDNQEILQLIKTTLGDSNQYIDAINGADGIEKAISMVPDLIISDVMMPIKDGYELCSTIKGEITTSHIPVILLTAKSSMQSKIDGLEYGADVYLSKPFNSRELRLQVRNLLLHKKALQLKYGKQKSWTSIWQDLPTSDRTFVEKLNAFLDSNLSNTELSLESMSKEMHLSPRQLRRKLHALTNQSPKQYLRSYRLKYAVTILNVPKIDIRDVAYQSGFSSPAYFSKCFKDEFGKTPTEFN